MPQSHRSVAFSGKKKREQMRAHKVRKLASEDNDQATTTVHQSRTVQGEVVNHEASNLVTTLEASGSLILDDVKSLNFQPSVNKNTNRFNLKFRRDDADELLRRKTLHNSPIELLSEAEMEMTSEDFYPQGLDYPNRPEWNSSMSRDRLDQNENRHLRLFCDRLQRDFGGQELSLFELNLETWRQLWRVTEMSDVLLIIVDARFPVAHFPPYLYHHLVERERKGIILVLNKCDLVPPSLVVAWKEYFAIHFPKLAFVPFSSVEGMKHKRGLLKMAAESSLRLVRACEEIVGNSVDLQPWKRKIEEEREMEYDDKCHIDEGVNAVDDDTEPRVYHQFQDGILTIGTIGHPNVGKSSLINALMGKKVVSVSRTPGHTKHFQTIFLTKKIRLCDCPGLVFPSTVTKPLQVILGSYPIAQYSDPMSAVHYVASRLDIPSVLQLSKESLLESEGTDGPWTTYYICEAWAKKRGFNIRTRGGRPDVSRAANELLRLCLVGAKGLVVALLPPRYSLNKAKFESDDELQQIKLIQGTVGEIKEDLWKEEVEVAEENEEDEDEEEDGEEEEVQIGNRNKFAILMADDDD